MNLRASTGLVALTVAAVVAFSGAATAQAAYPGQNGKIAFQRFSGGSWDIWVMNPDGSGQVNLTNTSTVTEGTPAWSPDGQRIAFVRSASNEFDLYTMKADGTSVTRLTTGMCVSAPSWSPEGTKIAFASGCSPPSYSGEIWVVNDDGSGAAQLTTEGYFAKYFPAWSPDGAKIAFSRGNIPNIYMMNPDGSGAVQVTHNPLGRSSLGPDWLPDGSRIAFWSTVGGDSDLRTIKPDGSGEAAVTSTPARTETYPAWSPDGTRLVFSVCESSSDFDCLHEYIGVMDADGSDQAQLTSGLDDIAPDWQPILKGYARPKAATPMYVSLVPAYQACTSPNRAHAAPLSFGSCTPPTQTSAQATVGTPDANGNPAKSVGALELRAIGEVPINTGNGNQSDITIDFSLTDVRNKITPADDYTGNLQVKTALQITDRNNTPHPGGPGPGTVSPSTFEFSVPCAATADATVGATCSLATTANTLIPGQVLERQRAVWQVGRVEVYNLGMDGTPGTLFAVQGIFIP